MKLKLSILMFLLLITQSVAEKETVPVFVLDFERVLTERLQMNNPLAKLSSASFATVVLNAKKASKRLVIFIDKTLSTEDLSLKDSRGTDFPNLQTVLKKGYVLYFPNVINPYITMKKIMQPSYHNIFYMGNPEKELRDMDKNLLYIYVYFQSKQNMSRINTLREHDYKIMATYKLLRQMSSGPIIGIYTALRNPINVKEMNRYIRTRKTEIPSRSVVVTSGDAMYRFSGVTVETPSHITNYDKTPTVGREVRSEHGMVSVLSYTDFDFEFKFTIDDKRWKIDSLALIEGGEEVGRTELNIGAPRGKSYVCSVPLTVINTRDLSAVTISQYQIQPRDVLRSKGREGTFDEAVICCPYFTVVIVQCLMVIVILLSILFSAFVFISGVKTMTKFEDPNSKTITIIEN